MNGLMRVDSYTSGVKPKVNNEWTEKSLRQVYTLRDKRGLSPAQIAAQFGVTRVEAHNAIRRARKLVSLACSQCGGGLTNDEILANQNRISKLCDGCKRQQREYKRQLREDALMVGKCGYGCGRDATPGHASCEQCRSATHRRRNLAGLCGKCGERPIRLLSLGQPGRALALCDQCAAEMRTTEETRS